MICGLTGLDKGFGKFGVIAEKDRKHMFLTLHHFNFPAAGFHWVIERLDFVQDRKLLFCRPVAEP